MALEGQYRCEVCDEQTSLLVTMWPQCTHLWLGPPSEYPTILHMFSGGFICIKCVQDVPAPLIVSMTQFTEG